MAAVELQRPSKLARTPLGNLLVAEVGTASPVNSGRYRSSTGMGPAARSSGGCRRPLNAVNLPSGPLGPLPAGADAVVSIGEGNLTLPVRCRARKSPTPPRVAALQCVLAVHFSRGVERHYDWRRPDPGRPHGPEGAGAVGPDRRVGGRITVGLVVDFPDYRPEPLPTLAANVRHSHPYGVVADDDFVYVVDGGYNVVHKAEILTGEFETLTSFPRTPNPGMFGPPMIENVPTSIRWDGDQLP